MAVFRVEKIKDYTVMSNYHLRDSTLSLKSKGLLSLMLSLPEDWDYTTKGLAYICKDGIDSISAALRELEDHGYLTRRRLRMPNGRLGTIEYTIHEQPQKPVTEPNPPIRENPVQVNPIQAFPEQAQPVLEKPAQLNIDKQNKERTKEKTEKNAAREYRELIKDNIEYDILVERYGAEKLDALVELMLEAVISDNPYCLIAKERFPREIVRSRMLKINSEHIEYVLEQFDETTSKVGNAKAYALAALFNAPVIMEHHYQFEVNHDMSAKRRRKE